MKTKTILFALISLVITTKSFSQAMTFGFVKNCMAYGRTTVTDELTKKQFFVKERMKKDAGNKLLEGSFYYSNEKTDVTKGEIAVLSQINDNKKITEISFVSGTKNDFSKNYTEVYDQMIKFFNNEKPFKSAKYGNTEVLMFSKDKIYYYTYTYNKIPVIVIANYKLEDSYF